MLDELHVKFNLSEGNSKPLVQLQLVLNLRMCYSQMHLPTTSRRPGIPAQKRYYPPVRFILTLEVRPPIDMLSGM